MTALSSASFAFLASMTACSSSCCAGGLPGRLRLRFPGGPLLRLGVLLLGGRVRLGDLQLGVLIHEYQDGDTEDQGHAGHRHHTREDAPELLAALLFLLLEAVLLLALGLPGGRDLRQRVVAEADIRAGLAPLDPELVFPKQPDLGRLG